MKKDFNITLTMTEQDFERLKKWFGKDTSPQDAYTNIFQDYINLDLKMLRNKELNHD